MPSPRHGRGKLVIEQGKVVHSGQWEDDQKHGACALVQCSDFHRPDPAPSLQQRSTRSLFRRYCVPKGLHLNPPHRAHATALQARDRCKSVRTKVVR